MNEVLVLNQCAHARIDPRFVPLIAKARTGMVACCGHRILELRLQGSIARGDARVGHADFDMIALLEGPPSGGENRCLAELAESLGASTKLVSRFDLEAIDANTLEPFRRFVLSSDSLCVYGADSLTQPMQSLERLALARLVTPDPATMLPDYVDWVDELTAAADGERRFASRIIGKDLLKVLRGVTLLRGAPYEVAIPQVAAEVSRTAPEAAEVVNRLLALYLEPTTNLEAIRQLVTEAAALLERCPEVSRLRGADSVACAAEGESTS